MFVTKFIIFKWPVVTSWIADNDDIYIMVECISVCLSQKSLFSSGQWSPAGLLMMTTGHLKIMTFVTDRQRYTPPLYIYRHHQQSNWWSLENNDFCDRQTEIHSTIIYISSSSTIQLVVT